MFANISIRKSGNCIVISMWLVLLFITNGTLAIAHRTPGQTGWTFYRDGMAIVTLMHEGRTFSIGLLENYDGSNRLYVQWSRRDGFRTYRAHPIMGSHN